MHALDFFCGAGGLTRGLSDAGIEVVAGFDCDDRCRATYEHNNPKARFVCKDIRDITLSDLAHLTSRSSFGDMLFVGCAPCQPFSKQRKNGEKVADATLLREFGRLVEAARPGMVLVENVPGIARVPGFSTYRRFIGLLSRCGYRYVYRVLDAKHYGVPQTRRRLVLIASLYFFPSLPEPRFGSTAGPFKTVRQAISHFPSLQAGCTDTDVPNHAAARLSELNSERIRYSPQNGGGRLAWPEHLRLNCHRNPCIVYSDTYGRMAWDRPAPTLTGKCRSISNGRYGHPEQDRAISLREAAALQSFSDDYVFFGTQTHIAKQIGNAVPVRMAEELGKHICHFVEQQSRVMA